jgi:hypothetical protein
MSRQRAYCEDKAIEIQIEKHPAETVLFQITEKRARILLLMEKKWRIRNSLMVLVLEI